MLYKLCPSLRYILSLDRLWFSTTQPRLINQVHLVCWFLWFKFWNLSREFWHPRQVMSITHPTWIICLSSKLEEVLLLLSVVKIWWSTLSPTYKSSSLEDLVEYFISYLTFSQNIYFDAPPWSMVKLLYFGLKLLWIILPSWQIKVDLKTSCEIIVIRILLAAEAFATIAFKGLLLWLNLILLWSTLTFTLWLVSLIF